MKKLLVALSFCAVLAACKTPKQSSQTNPENYTAAETKTETVATPPAPATEDSLFVYLERTACYGQCPMYKFSIYNSGYAVYEGKRFVEKLGKYEARISKTELDEIRSKARAINYFDFKDEYPKTASDFPATKTAVVLDGKRKDIMDGSNAPSALKEFEKYLDSVKDSAEWRQVH
ncbi:MAG: hypothetical protein POELPBGB_01543 [Bacteroidia bacterium]|nr:hypothetical protein [Bacteroidia bacterium]